MQHPDRSVGCMSLLPNDYLASLDEASVHWPGALRDEQVLVRFESALAFLPSVVRAALVDTLLAGQPKRALALMQGLALAGLRGATPEGIGEQGQIRMRDLSGSPFLLDALCFGLSPHPAGAAIDRQRVNEALEGVLHGQRFAVYLRRPVTPGYDPSELARAVHLWSLSLERGEWEGRSAIYEDDDASIEVILLNGRPPGRAHSIGPLIGLDRLSLIVEHVDMWATTPRMETEPTVLVLAADARWRLPRGTIHQQLYGTPSSVLSAHDGTASFYEATYRRSESALFGSREDLRALWWIDPCSSLDDPLAFRCVSSDNPWARGGDLVLPGTMVVKARGADGAVTVRWGAEHMQVWLPEGGTSL